MKKSVIDEHIVRNGEERLNGDDEIKDDDKQEPMLNDKARVKKSL